MVAASVLTLELIAVPSAVKAATTAIATKAAATAYSDNSRPVSSRKNFLIIFLLLIVWLWLSDFRLPSSASKEGSRNLLSRPHKLRVPRDCDAPRLLAE